MSRLIAGARGLFKRHPFVTNSAIYGSLYVGAEFSQQYVSKRWLAVSAKKKKRLSVYLFLVWGSVIRFMCLCRRQRSVRISIMQLWDDMR